MKLDILTYLNRRLIIIEESKITYLWCHQHTLGERQITCVWVANLHALFYEIVFTGVEGSNKLKMNVSEESVSVELETDMGNIIGITVNDVSTKVLLKGKYPSNFLTPKQAFLLYRNSWCHQVRIDIFWHGPEMHIRC